MAPLAGFEPATNRLTAASPSRSACRRPHAADSDEVVRQFLCDAEWRASYKRTRELVEARELQAATAEVLSAVRRSRRPIPRCDGSQAIISFRGADGAAFAIVYRDVSRHAARGPVNQAISRDSLIPGRVLDSTVFLPKNRLRGPPLPKIPKGHWMPLPMYEALRKVKAVMRCAPGPHTATYCK
jgi:hypothetical protein